MKGTIKVLNNQGHTAVEYNTEAGVVEEAYKVLEDAARFHAHLFDGQTRESIGQAPGRGGGTPPTRDKQNTILREHDEVIVVPPMAGGA